MVGRDVICVTLIQLFLLFAGQPEQKLLGDLSGDFSLDVEYLRWQATIALAPKVRAISGVNQFGFDHHMFIQQQDSSREHRPHT